MATANRVTERLLNQDEEKNHQRIASLFEEPTVDFPKPSFSVLPHNSVTQAQILQDTPQDMDPFALIKDDIASLNEDVKYLLSNEATALGAVARYFFEHEGGKRVRPSLVIMFGRALDTERRLIPQQKRLAEITEMIHTASLLHDDVIDQADTRRGVHAAHQKFGNKRAILGGDLLLARSSVSLARLRSLNAVEAMSTVVGDMVKGEVMQLSTISRQDEQDHDVVSYLAKNYYKTGSLIANSCMCAVFLAHEYSSLQANERTLAKLQETAFRYGEALGQAFQLVDDALDFEGSFASLGKPSLADVKLGIATYPVLMASRLYPKLLPMIQRKFREEGDVEYALQCVLDSDSIAKTRDMALQYSKVAADFVRSGLDPSPERDALVKIASIVADRRK